MNTTSPTPIKVDIVSDVACPWCYVGKRRLENAIAQWEGTPIEIEWHPYQLDPNMPTEGLTRDTYLGNKFGDVERAKQMTDHLTNVGKEVGIDFDFGDTWLAVNTLPLHQMLAVAGQEGFNDILKERFLKAYFVETLHLNDTNVLETIGAEFGWSSEKVQSIIQNEALGKAVQQKIAQYQERGVTGVPFFIINNQYGISGAQPSDVFLDAFKQITTLENTPEGESCDVDGKNC
jgi:predicted DsbA family dithiol-disulfide isomerase